MSSGTAFRDDVCLSVQGLYFQHTTTTPGPSRRPLSRQRSHRPFPGCSITLGPGGESGRSLPAATPGSARWPRPGPVGGARPS